MIARIRPLLSIALSGLLVLSACGKNDGSASSNTSATNSTPSPAAATTNTTGSTAAVATALGGNCRTPHFWAYSTV